MSFGFNEDLLQFIWEHQLFDSGGLQTIDGEIIAILKQGLLNKNSGPDFENAKITIGETEFYGAIEIHLDSTDWNAHGHTQDTAYNQVILHVCYNANANVKRQDGSEIPTVELNHRINKSALLSYQNLMQEQAFVPCAKLLPSLDSFTIATWVERMLVERMEERCDTFKYYQEKTNGNWNQTFYTAVVRAFGMPINKEAFEDIAFALPFEIIHRHSESLFQLEALFFGTTGLLHELKEIDSYVEGLQNEYAFLSAKYGLSPISSQLKFGRMRPMSLPSVKLAQLAALWHHSPNLVANVIELPKLEVIRNNLKFETSDYWKTHYSLYKTSASVSKQLSATAIQLLLLNAIIPFSFYYQKSKNDGNTEKALNYLTELKSEKNSIILEWQKLGVEVNDAFSSQGVLHLYKYYCSKKMCLSCNIGRKILLKSI
jgi:hypothetical protein